MLKREHLLKEIEQQLRIHSVCALLGPRQVGKTTLAHLFIEKKYKDNVRFFDLEKLSDLALLDNPESSLAVDAEKLVMIDEIQMRPDLFPTIRVIVDEPPRTRKFLILGSASRDLIQQSSETLAGRIGYIEVAPFSLAEVKNLQQLWLRGGFPNSYLAASDSDSFSWRQNYINTFLERDLPMLGFSIPPVQLRRFWLMLVHYHGQTFNASEIGRSLGISDHTSRKYLDILAGTFMIRTMVPWFENVQKRQVKLPKIYFRDSGILHALLNLETMEQLHTYPKLGAFWEGFAIEEIIKHYRLRAEECFFWGTQGGAELDLMILRGGKRIGFECKYTDSPKITKSMMVAMEDLKLDHIYLIHPHQHTYPLAPNMTAMGLPNIVTLP